MSKIEINTPASDFTLDDFSGRTWSLAGSRASSNILLVFNRGFL